MTRKFQTYLRSLTSNPSEGLLLLSLLLLNVGHSSFLPIVRAISILACLFEILIPKLRTSYFIWAILSLSMGWDIFFNGRFWMANHYYLAFYTSLCVLINSSIRNSRTDDLEKSLVALFVVFMGLAAVHKVVSPLFMSGDFIATILMTNPHFDVYFSKLMGVNFAAAARANSLFEVKDVYPLGMSFHMQSNPKLFDIAQVMTWGTIVIEFLLIVLVAFKSTRNFFAYALLTFVAVTSLIRPEYAFLGLCSFYGFVLSPCAVIKRSFAFLSLFFAASSAFGFSLIELIGSFTS